MCETRTCKHHQILGYNQLPKGGWMGGVSRCKCCLGIFGYCDSGTYDSSGYSGIFWSPKDLCGTCGGEYKELGNKLGKEELGLDAFLDRRTNG